MGIDPTFLPLIAATSAFCAAFNPFSLASNTMWSVFATAQHMQKSTKFPLLPFFGLVAAAPFLVPKRVSKFDHFDLDRVQTTLCTSKPLNLDLLREKGILDREVAIETHDPEFMDVPCAPTFGGYRLISVASRIPVAMSPCHHTLFRALIQRQCGTANIALPDALCLKDKVDEPWVSCLKDSWDNIEPDFEVWVKRFPTGRQTVLRRAYALYLRYGPIS